jgi:hypothetical protein
MLTRYKTVFPGGLDPTFSILSRHQIPDTSTLLFTDLVTSLFHSFLSSDLSQSLSIQRNLISLLQTHPFSIDLIPPFTDLLEVCFSLIRESEDDLSVNSFEILSIILLQSDSNPSLGRFYLTHGFLDLLHHDPLPLHSLDITAAFMIQSIECRDSILQKSPLSNWLTLLRDRNCCLHREILHIVSAILFFPLSSESDILTISLIFEHLLHRCSSDIVEETFESLAIACENHPDYQFFVTQNGIFEKMMEFLRAHEHCVIISRVIRLIARKIEVSLNFEILQKLFCFVITGEIADQGFIENMCQIVELSCCSSDLIEVVMRAGGGEVLRIASEEGAFESKIAAVKAIQRIVKCGCVQQKCFIVESGILERVLECVELTDLKIANVFLEMFGGLVEAVLVNGEVRLIQIMVELLKSEPITELGESEDLGVLEMIREIEFRISNA